MQEKTTSQSRDTLSASLTLLFGRGLPFILLLVIAATWTLALRNGKLGWSLVGLLLGSVISVLFCVFLLRIKNLRMDGGKIRVKGLWKSYEFETKAIQDIYFVKGRGISFIRLTVTPSKKGQAHTVWFIPPPYVTGWVDGVHPTVLQLRRLRGY